MIKNSDELKDLIVRILEDKKAENIIELDLGEKSSLTRYMIIASGRSVKNTTAIAEFLSYELKNKTNINILLDGLNTGQWVVVDAGEVIVHLFHPESRKIFRLEEIWEKK